jgi:excinuclease UvrABC nuclease subunit
MRKTKKIAPYSSQGKSNLKFAIGRPGVYLIYKNGKSKPSYVGFSASNVYKTCLRHFQSWKDKKQVRTTYPKRGYLVRIVLCGPLQAARLEKYLIVKLQPFDNPMKLDLYRLSAEEKIDGKKYEKLNDFMPDLGDAPF